MNPTQPCEIYKVSSCLGGSPLVYDHQEWLWEIHDAGESDSVIFHGTLSKGGVGAWIFLAIGLEVKIFTAVITLKSVETTARFGGLSRLGVFLCHSSHGDSQSWHRLGAHSFFFFVKMGCLPPHGLGNGGCPPKIFRHALRNQTWLDGKSPLKMEVYRWENHLFWWCGFSSKPAAHL